METTKTDKVKGLTANIHVAKGFPDCSNGGISAYAKVVTILTDIPECQLSESDGLTAPPVITERGPLGNLHVRPLLDPPKGEIGWMFGGTFIHTSDSRFRHISPTGQPIPLHDRSETPEQYERLSN